MTRFIELCFEFDELSLPPKAQFEAINHHQPELSALKWFFPTFSVNFPIEVLQNFLASRAVHCFSCLNRWAEFSTIQMLNSFRRPRNMAIQLISNSLFMLGVQTFHANGKLVHSSAITFCVCNANRLSFKYYQLIVQSHEWHYLRFAVALLGPERTQSRSCAVNAIQIRFNETHSLLKVWVVGLWSSFA